MNPVTMLSDSLRARRTDKERVFTVVPNWAQSLNEMNQLSGGL